MFLPVSLRLTLQITFWFYRLVYIVPSFFYVTDQDSCWSRTGRVARVSSLSSTGSAAHGAPRKNWDGCKTSLYRSYLPVRAVLVSYCPE
jgi:hypothetical protein